MNLSQNMIFLLVLAEIFGKDKKCPQKMQKS